jgi:hypothetical protein
MFDRGKLAVLTMLGLAVLAATFAWWWNLQRGHLALAFFGSQGAGLVGHAPTVELIAIQPAKSEDRGEHLLIGSEPFSVVSRHDVSRAKGLIHARTALLDDASYEWQSPTADLAPGLFIVRFAQGRAESLLAIDCQGRQLYRCDTGAPVRLNPKIATGWQKFFERNVPVDSTVEK